MEIAKGCDAWVDWRPMKDRAAMMLDVSLRGLVRDKSVGQNSSVPALSSKDAVAKGRGKK